MSCQHGVCPNLRAPSLLALNSVQHDKRSCFPVSFLLGRGYFLPPFPQLLPPLSLHLPGCRVRCALPTFTATHIVRVGCLMVLSVQWSGLWEATNISWHSFESDCKVTESDSNNSTIIYSLDPCLLSPLFLDALTVWTMCWLALLRWPKPCSIPSHFADANANLRSSIDRWRPRPNSQLTLTYNICTGNSDVLNLEH